VTPRLARDPLPSGLALTQLDPAFREDPHPRLDRLRRDAPVYWDAAFGHFFVTAYPIARAILTDLTFLRDPAGAAPEANHTRIAERRARTEAPIGGMAQLDDPDHARVRRPIARALNARMLQAEPLVRDVVRTHLANLTADEVDLISAFAVPIPSDVIALVLGVDRGDLVRFRAWSEALIKIFHPARSSGDLLAIARARRDVGRYLAAVLRARRERPADDLVSDLVALQTAGEPLSDEEILVNCQALLVAGNLTTADLIGNATWLLLRHPGERARMASEPDHVDAIVEETLRLESPVDITVRIAPDARDLHGCPVARRQAVTLSLKAANRDPAVYAGPDLFLPGRTASPHLAFGGGAHICIGRPLARLEARLALSTLFARFPHMTLADPAGSPDWRETPFFHGLRSLRVRLGRSVS